MHPATKSDRITAIRETLISAVAEGAQAVLSVKASGGVQSRFKTAEEVVTTADERADHAILSVFREKLSRIDPEISFYLEESGMHGSLDGKWVGADPIDGTNHFACGGNFYAVQAHYVEDGVPVVGVICQPEMFLPLSESSKCIGRLAWAVRGEGAFVQQTLWEGSLVLREQRSIAPLPHIKAKALTGCVPLSAKMTPRERASAIRVLESGLISTTTGLGGAAANIMMTVFGGSHLYANFGAGEDLDLIPGQVIAQEAGLCVRDSAGKTPVWQTRKQAMIVAQDAAIAERVLEIGQDQVLHRS